MIELPCVVDGTKASAHSKDDMMEITLPRVEKSKRHANKID